MKRWLEQAAGYLMLAGIVFGLFIVVVAPLEMAAKAEAETWPARRAVITTSYASKERGSRAGAVRGDTWKPQICGRYTDNGERFCVRRVRYGGIRLGADHAGAHATVAKYPVGAEVDIHFDPDDPRQTVLEAHSPWTEMIVLFGTGAGLLLVPALLWAWRRVRG